MLNFPTLILYLLNLRKHSNQVELDQFFKAIHKKEQATQHITKSAFFQARKELSHTAFIDLNHQLVADIYRHTPHEKQWRGLRLCAIDGSSVRLPYEPDITAHFGVQKGKANQADCSMGMVSVFYDVLNHIVIDASLSSTRASERDCAGDHLKHAGNHDLVLYDRGYNSFWLYAHHIQHHRAFCMRAKTRQSLAIKAFLKSNQQEAIITLEPNQSSIKTCQARGLSTAPITLRVVRVDLPGEVEVLITNLMDTTRYDACHFQSLYHLRWGIEENYKRLKQWVEIENFSGKSALSVLQDFHAKIIAMNLTALMAMPAQQIIDNKTKNYQHHYQINFAQALSKMKHRLVSLIQRAQGSTTRLIEQTIYYLSQTIEAIRDGRSVPRTLKNLKNKLHFPAYKSTL